MFNSETNKTSQFISIILIDKEKVSIIFNDTIDERDKQIEDFKQATNIIDVKLVCELSKVDNEYNQTFIVDFDDPNLRKPGNTLFIDYLKNFLKMNLKTVTSD